MNQQPDEVTESLHSSADVLDKSCGCIEFLEESDG